MGKLKDITDGFHLILERPDLHTVTVFCSPLGAVKERVRVTRARKRMGYHVEIGKPNYAERQFLKLCKKAKTNPRRFYFH